MKIIKILSHIILTLAFVAYIAYQFRTDPVVALSGKKLSGDELTYPSDWAFSNDFRTIAVETRVGNPHSVTTICFIHEGELYIPAQNGSEKDWPQYVLADPRVRLKVGDQVYPAAMSRVTDFQINDFLASIVVKYPQATRISEEDGTEDLWLFRVSDR